MDLFGHSASISSINITVGCNSIPLLKTARNADSDSPTIFDSSSLPLIFKNVAFSSSEIAFAINVLPVPFYTHTHKKKQTTNKQSVSQVSEFS